MADALSQRPVSCVAKLEEMGIPYDHRADVFDRELVVVMVRLAISSTVLDQIK